MKATQAQLRAALDRPPATLRLILLHGPDEAAAQDHAARLGRAMGAGAERVDLDGAALKASPARLIDEAAALSLFGDTRWIRVTGVGDESVEAVELLLAASQAGNPVVAIGPGLKTTSRLVKLAIAHPQAMTFACYVPTGQNAEAIAADIARALGLRPVGGTARRVAEASGGDRAVMTRELEKLALYLDAAPDQPRELDDAALDAVGADLGEAEAGSAIAAIAAGQLADLGQELGRLREAGVSPVAWLRQLSRRLMLMAELRAEADRGGDAKALMKRRGVHFSEENALAAALRRWTQPMLAQALTTVGRAQRDAMAPGNAGDVLASETALELARAVDRRR